MRLDDCATNVKAGDRIVELDARDYEVRLRQARAALDAGLAVLCQKPLALDAAQTREVIAAARRANRLLAVDMSYRYLRSVTLVKQLVDAGEIGLEALQ